MTDKEKSTQLIETSETLEKLLGDLQALRSKESACMDEIEKLLMKMKQLSAAPLTESQTSQVEEIKSDAQKAMTLNDRFRFLRGDGE